MGLQEPRPNALEPSITVANGLSRYWFSRSGPTSITDCVVRNCRALAEADSYGITRIFTLTYQPSFFRKLGFKDIDKSELPHKVWSDCINCSKFPDCNEEALIWEKNS